MLIILNHKMNLNIDEIKEYEKILRDYDVVVMPQTPYMSLFTHGKYTLGSQCVSEYNAPGGVSAESLAAMNVKYVLVGHYERRNIARDTDEVIKKKIVKTLEYQMSPILCVGDNNEDDIDMVKKQIDSAFSNLGIDLNKIIIAYEPIHSIGTNQMLEPHKITEKIKYIKDFLKEKYLLDNEILYGGSINSNNIEELIKINLIDGIIIGSASLNIKEVIDIYNKVNS